MKLLIDTDGVGEGFVVVDYAGLGKGGKKVLRGAAAVFVMKLAERIGSAASRFPYQPDPETDIDREGSEPGSEFEPEPEAKYASNQKIGADKECVAIMLLDEAEAIPAGIYDALVNIQPHTNIKFMALFAPTGAPEQDAKYTPENVAILTNVLESGGSRRGAYGHLGISRKRFYRWMDHFPEFRASVLAAEARVARIIGMRRGRESKVDFAIPTTSQPGTSLVHTGTGIRIFLPDGESLTHERLAELAAELSREVAKELSKVLDGPAISIGR